ncbi:MAG: hypothetical protein Roseis2KO_03800 [Roseivirga sp.]
MNLEGESFWDHYVMKPTKRNKEIYSFVSYDVLEEQELNLEEIDEKYVDDLVLSIQYLSTPGEEKYHSFGIMPSELSLIKNSTIRSIKRSLWSPLGYSLLLIPLIFAGVIFSNGRQDSSFSFDTFYLFFLVLIPLFRAAVRYVNIRQLGSDNINQWLEYNRFNRWLSDRSFALSWYLPLIIGIFFAWQYGSWDFSVVDLFGLTKPLADLSMSYKLFTVVLVHANFLHLISNLAALYFLSNLFMQFASYRRLLLVFFVSAITGSLFSILLLPDTTSVGASGAILGLLGFVLAISVKYRSFIPRQFTMKLLSYVVLTAILGLFIFDMVDNGAHLGGLLGGMVIGFFYSKQNLLDRLNMFYQEALEKHERRKAKMEADRSGVPLPEPDINEDAPPNLR